jgi:signal transduction histidine kinase
MRKTVLLPTKSFKSKRGAREQIQAALEKERELRLVQSRFLSMMGHEFNAPLTSISLSYDMLKKYRHIATEEENEQALDNIQQQVAYLHDMVKDVIMLSRSDSDGLQLEAEETDLMTYCRDVVEEFTFAYHRSHHIEFECDEDDIRAQIDRRVLRRVFTNLLSNAIKYSPNGGTIIFRLSMDYDSDSVQIQVIDSGIGIPKEDIPRLFEPFYRATNIDNLVGTGLGLAIVKQIVDLHCGTIKVESIPNIGSTFTVMLPLSQDSQSQPQQITD